MNLLARSKGALFDPESTIGPFRVESKLPKPGGMSELYVAHYILKPNHKVVLKINRQSEINNENPANVFQDLLRKEVRMLRELRHPGVVRILPFTLYEKDTKVTFQAKLTTAGTDLWYYAMEYLSAGNLEDRLSTISRMPVEWVVELFYQLLITVQYMHRLGYAHCDLKPVNIMLREPPDQNKIPQPVLIDFGCTEKLDKFIQTPCAAPSYSPPEVLLAMQRSDLDPLELKIKPEKIDVWSLGAIFYGLLTGKPMFGQKDRKEVTSQVIKGEIARIGNTRFELHSSLDTLLNAMMRKNPDERADLDKVIIAIEEKISSVRPPRLPSST
jgi:serine/threonine protein kinase